MDQGNDYPVIGGRSMARGTANIVCHRRVPGSFGEQRISPLFRLPIWRDTGAVVGCGVGRSLACPDSTVAPANKSLRGARRHAHHASPCHAPCAGRSRKPWWVFSCPDGRPWIPSTNGALGKAFPKSKSPIGHIGPMGPVIDNAPSSSVLCLAVFRLSIRP